MIRFAIPLVILAACAANAALPQKTADPEEAKIAKRLAGLTPGKPQDCVERHRVSETQGYATTVLYIGGRTKVWRNDLQGSCPGLARGDLMVVESISGDICRGDTVRTRARLGGMLTGSCALGSFTPYSK
jgi:hypothetical protein